MIAKLDILEKKLKSIPFKLFLYQILLEHKEEIEDQNIDQLQSGEDALGRKIRPRYVNQGYAAFKNSVNPRPGRGTPDLKDTGDFYRGIEARVTRQNLIMTGTDEKTEQLQFKYGEEIIGINMNKATFKEDFILPELREKVRQYLRA